MTGETTGVATEEARLQRILERLAEQYAALPPEAIRWHTHQGRDFLIALQQLPPYVTNRRVAAVLGRQASTVSILRRKRVTWSTWPFPQERDLRRLRRAWKAVQERRARHQHVRPGSPEFTEMQAAVVEILSRVGVPLEFLPHALQGVRTESLRRFLRPNVPR